MVDLTIRLIVTLFISFHLNSLEFSVMTLNADNLFDTKDDLKKDDKAFLPIELKKSNKHKESCLRIKVKSWRDECLFLDWNESIKNYKLSNIVSSITSYEINGPDILALQEIENLNILNQLLTLLKPYGYIDAKLLEGDDFRGIDTAVISKFNIVDARLHKISFKGKYKNKKTRPILDITLDVFDNKIKIYNIHFPSGFNDVSMRIDSLNTLNKLLLTHDLPSIALGDFNINSKEDKSFNLYKFQEDLWNVAHISGCNFCKGTYFYNNDKTWQFLDSIFLSKNRGMSYVTGSIKIHTNNFNSFPNTGKPKIFNTINKEGVSDHLPMVAKIKLN